ncbi:MAG: hypothetical protein IKQ69_02435 [Oscillospiraceae bacterium]|nr:hypothetical protein [Oscillospiraceae bacterium]
MERLLQRIASLFCASTLMLSISGRAFAQDDEQPLDPPAEIRETASGDALGTPDASEVPEKTDNTDEASMALLAAPQTDTGLTDPDVQTDGEPKSGEADQSGETQATPEITVAGTSFSPDENSSGSGWSYEADSQSIVLVNYDGARQSILSTASDVTIKMAGVNRLAELSVDGNINLVGTGVLLVDKIEMTENMALNLQSNKEIYGEDGGSVAVFLLQDDNSYLLINGSVDAILDEAYTLPQDVTLVVPDGSRLVLQSLAVGCLLTEKEEKVVRYSTNNEDEVIDQLRSFVESEDGGTLDVGNIDFYSTSAKLTIPQKTKLVISEMASILMKSVRPRTFSFIAPVLDVQGTLELNGSVTGESWYQSFVVLNSDLSGEGTISKAEVSVNVPQDALTVNDVNLRLNAGTSAGAAADGEDPDITPAIGTLTMSDTNVLSFNNSAVGELVLQDGASVDLRRHEGADVLALGQISGSGTVGYDDGSFAVGSVGAGIAQDFGTTGITTCGDVTYISGPDGAVPIPTQTQGGTIPVVNVSFVLQNATSLMGGGVHSIVSESESQDSESITLSGDTVSFASLVQQLLPTGSATQTVEVYTVGVDGILATIKLSSRDADDQTEIPVASIRLIRTVESTTEDLGTGGGASTSTNTSYTGSGVLGGPGAGSVPGGTQFPILRGAGIHRTQPNDDDPSNHSGGQQLGQTNTEADQGLSDADFWVEPDETGTCSVLCAVDGEATLKAHGGVASVSMSYTPPEGSTAKSFYVVFRDSSGTLRAFRASYSRLRSELSFEAECLGRFVVVAFDFDGEVFSDAFYEALAQREELSALS